MRRPLGAVLALCALLSGSAAAQIGQPPGELLAQLASLGPSETAAGYEAESVRFALETRRDALSRVTGDATLDAAGRVALAELIGAATGYGESIAQPVAELLGARAAELAAQGEVSLGVEEFLLVLTVTGEAEPYAARFALELPQLDEVSFPLARHTMGPADAAFVVREFSDFQCPFCAQYAAETLPQLKEALLARGDVRFEYHHLPLTSIHANAQLAAEAAECVVDANDPESFWTYHDALFERQAAWAGLGDPGPYFVRLAREVGLSDGGVAACLSEGRYTEAVQEATRIATQELGLNSTPTVFVGGLRVPGGAAGSLAGYETAIARLEAFGD